MSAGEETRHSAALLRGMRRLYAVQFVAWCAALVSAGCADGLLDWPAALVTGIVVAAGILWTLRAAERRIVSAVCVANGGGEHVTLDGERDHAARDPSAPEWVRHPLMRWWCRRGWWTWNVAAVAVLAVGLPVVRAWSGR